MVVAKQRGHPDKTVGKLASEIVAKWRKTVEAEKAKKMAKMASSPAKTSSPAPTATEVKAFVGDKAKRRWETDKVDIKRTGTPSRDACIGLLYNGLAFMSEEAPTAVVIKAVEVEEAAFKAFNGDNPEYRAKLRSLFQNLKNQSNRDLGPRVMSGEIPASRFVVMSHEELKSAQRRAEDEKLNEDNMKKAQVPMAEKSISDALRCGRCGQKKVSYTQAQTRSADEPMTTFCECTVCGNRWKVCVHLLYAFRWVLTVDSSHEFYDLRCTYTKNSVLRWSIMDGLAFGDLMPQWYLLPDTIRMAQR
jgi:transcription elongation factor S-II